MFPPLPISLSANSTWWADFNKLFEVGEQKLKFGDNQGMGDLKISLDIIGRHPKMPYYKGKQS